MVILRTSWCRSTPLLISIKHPKNANKSTCKPTLLYATTESLSMYNISACFLLFAKIKSLYKQIRYRTSRFGKLHKTFFHCLSTAPREPVINDRATAMPPFFFNKSFAPGCVLSIMFKNTSSHTKYLFNLL